MADIFRAFKFMNDALGLKLSDLQIARAEAKFKLDFGRQEKYDLNAKNLHQWEFFAHLAPRRDFSEPELAKAALEHIEDEHHKS